jgi:hypothetical protein
LDFIARLAQQLAGNGGGWAWSSHRVDKVV